MVHLHGDGVAKLRALRAGRGFHVRDAQRRPYEPDCHSALHLWFMNLSFDWRLSAHSQRRENQREDLNGGWRLGNGGWDLRRLGTSACRGAVYQGAENQFPAPSAIRRLSGLVDRSTAGRSSHPGANQASRRRGAPSANGGAKDDLVAMGACLGRQPPRSSTASRRASGFALVDHAGRSQPGAKM
jgi:hypothetical protein